jgi:hypothetical protein
MQLLLLVVLSLLVLTTWPETSAASQPSPGYDHCVNKTMHEKLGNTAEREAKNLCHEEYPDSEPKVVELTPEAIKKLKIVASFGWEIFSGSIYNGNSDYFITQLTITIHGHHMEKLETTSHEAKEYIIDLQLPPLSKSALSAALDMDEVHNHDLEWEVISVLGHKAN